MQDFKKLKVWEKSHKLTLEVYEMTNSFPKKEEFRLTSQLIRAVSSIATNIAEGCGRESNMDMNRFLVIARGSASEAEYLLLLAKDLKYITEDKYNKLTSEIIDIRKMLYSLIKAISKYLKYLINFYKYNYEQYD